MMNPTLKSTEKSISDGVSQAVASVAHAAEELRTGIAESAESTYGAIKTEVGHASRATRDLAALAGAEVVKRPLTFTLAAAGAGALVGVSMMAMFKRPKGSLQ